MYLDIPFRGNSEMMYLILSACAMMLSGNGKCWMIVSRWDRKCVKIVGNPKILERMVLIIDETKNIGARVKGLVRPRPPEMMLRDAICSACSGRESM